MGVHLAYFALAAVVPIAITLLYFGALRAIDAMHDIVVLGNRHYAKTFKNATTFEAIRNFHRDELLTLSMLGRRILVSAISRFPLALLRRDRAMLERACLAVALLVGASAAVTMQQKFFGVHWVTLVGALTFAVAALFEDARVLLARRVGMVAAWAIPLSAVAVACYYTPVDLRVLPKEHRLVSEYVTGKISREQYAKNFFSPPMNYYQVDIDAVSEFLTSRARPDDAVCVRGSSTQIYAQTGMRFEGRLFWTNHIWNPLSYRHDDFVKEDRESIVRTRPRFIVTEKNREGLGCLESAELYTPLGYRIVREAGVLQVLERVD